MEKESYSEKDNGKHWKLLIESSSLLVRLDQQDFVEPVQEEEVQNCNWIEDWHTSRVS